MIIYEYKCRSCEKEFDAFSSVNDRNELKKCPECGEDSGEHIITPTNFALNGLDPSFPGAYDKWTRDHEKAGKLGKQKDKEEAGDLASSMY